ncbi:MAG: cobalt ECF transporter T component CbiQ [Alphaproteobacteria bacterium]
MHRVDRLAHDNRLSQRHPVEKLALAGGMLCLGLVLPPWPGAAIVAVVMAAAALGPAGVAVGDYLRVLAVPAGFLAAGLAVLPLALDLGPGGPSLSLSPEGLALAVGTGLRALAGVSCLTFLAVTTPPADLVWVLRRLRVSPAVIDIMLLTYRFVMCMTEVAARGMIAQQARLGWSSVPRRVRSAGMLAAALLPRTLDRARRLELGLAARGYDGVLAVPVERPGPSPVVLLAIGLVEAVVALAAQWPS